jgi:dephospho-CoA kinase
MKSFGLTGGIGMGKSTAAELLRKRGVPTVDSDEIARQLVEPGQPALREIRREFGGNMVDADGRLRRDELARLVFVDAGARRKLEETLHPRIRSVWQDRLRVWREEGRPVAVAVIPLLFETDAAGHFDATVCVACSVATQRKRLHERGWSDDQINLRNQAQLAAEKKMAFADFVVWTEAGLDVHEAQLKRIIPWLDPDSP